MRFSVRYSSVAEFLSDYDQQLCHGGLLVRGAAPLGIALYDSADVELRWPAGSAILRGQVVQLVAGIGVAVAIAPAELAALEPAVQAARKGEVSPATKDAETAEAHERVHEATAAEKLQLAVHGSRDERSLILRENNRNLHLYVLRNPHIQLDEVHAIAKMSTVAVVMLETIAGRMEWSSRPEIALALVRNPKTPIPTAVRLLANVLPQDVRMLAKDPHVRVPIARAARAKVNR